MPEKALKATHLNMPFCNRKGIILCIKTFIDCKMASGNHVAFLKILKVSMPESNSYFWIVRSSIPSDLIRGSGNDSVFL